MKNLALMAIGAMLVGFSFADLLRPAVNIILAGKPSVSGTAAGVSGASKTPAPAPATKTGQA